MDEDVRFLLDDGEIDRGLPVVVSVSMVALSFSVDFCLFACWAGTNAHSHRGELELLQDHGHFRRVRGVAFGAIVIELAETETERAVAVEGNGFRGRHNVRSSVTRNSLEQLLDWGCKLFLNEKGRWNPGCLIFPCSRRDPDGEVEITTNGFSGLALCTSLLSSWWEGPPLPPLA